MPKLTNQLTIIEHPLVSTPEITPRNPAQSNPRGETTLTRDELTRLLSDPSLTRSSAPLANNVVNGFNPANLFRSPSSFVPEHFGEKYDKPQGIVQNAVNFNHDLAGYLGWTQSAISLAANWLTLGSLANFGRPSNPVQSNPRNSNQVPLKKGFDSHKPIIRNYLEGVSPLPKTIRPSIHGTAKPYQPTSLNRVPTGNRWHNPNIRTPSQRTIRNALEGVPRALDEVKRFPIHDVGKWFKPSTNPKLPPPPC